MAKIMKLIKWNSLYILFVARNFFKKYKSKKIILVGTPLHGNIGDHAIAVASYKFLKDTFPDYDIIEIPSKLIRINPAKFKSVIGESMIFITGGGFMGSLWSEEEEMVQSTIKFYHMNKIIVLPQTIYFDNDRDMIAAKKIYNCCDHLYIIAREESTYLLAQNLIDKKHVFFCPDIVLYLEFRLSIKRSGVLLCFRNDKEKIMNQEDIQYLKDLLMENNISVRTTDTVVHKNIFPNQRKKYVDKKINEFAKSRLVITDRLHGMIFSCITKTPCIAFNNKSGKVNGVIRYLSKCTNYILSDTKMDDIMKNIEYLLNIEIDYNKTFLNQKFTEIKNMLKELEED